MKKMLSIIAACLLSTSVAAQSASESPLTNPDIVEPPGSEQGSNPNPNKDGLTSENDSSPMTYERLAAIVGALDANATIGIRGMQFTVQEVPVTIIVDARANRMRAFSPFKTLDGVDGQTLYRMMQANFDSALDARYAIAKGYLISVFIHPLGELQKDQFIEGVGQVVNLVKTFGTAYTSGAMTFGGGDSQNLHRELIDELLKKGKEI